MGCKKYDFLLKKTNIFFKKSVNVLKILHYITIKKINIFLLK